jgi:hypothetical protein
MSLALKPHQNKPGRFLVSMLILALSFGHLWVGAQNLNKVEYYFDTDPGLGLGTNVPVTTPSANLTNFDFNVSINALSQGFHRLQVRARDENGKWSFTHSHHFYKVVANTSITNIVQLEYFFDADPGFGNGTSIPFSPDTNITNLSYSIPIGSLTNGFHKIIVRAKDAAGAWSTCHSLNFYKETYIPQTADVVALEYFFDTDPGYGNGNPIPVTIGTNVELNDYSIPLNALSNGFHNIIVRSKDSFGRWSHAVAKSFYKETYTPVTPNLTALEYFFDTDPGFGHGKPIPITAGQNFEVNDFLISLDSIGTGFHQLFVRAKDDNNRWSLTSGKAFFKDITNTSLANIVKMEYFFDADPGFGNGSNIPIAQGTLLNNVVYNIPIFALSNGFHKLQVRVKDAEGKWSLTTTHPFYKEAYVPELPDVVKVEYFLDTDPGFGSGINVPIAGDTTFTEQDVIINLATVSEGFHKIFFRAKDSKGKWSLTSFRPFYKQIWHDTLPDVVKVEYFYDTDPGFGNGINVPFTPTQNLSFLAFALNLNNVAFGQHILNIRVKDNYGKWSLVSQDTVFYYLSSLPTASLEGPQATCIYAPAEFTVTLTGTGPWTIIYNTGEEIDTVSGIQTPFYNFTVTPQTSGVHTAQVLKVTDSQYTGLYTGIPIEYQVNPMPAAAGTITGSANVCRGSQSVAFYVPGIANVVDYVWTVPQGCTYTQYNNYWWYYGSVIYVNFPAGAQSGDISVHGQNGCGIAASSSFHVDVRELPSVDAGQDVIIDYSADTTLTAVVTGGNEPYSYSWSPWYYCNNTAIANPLVTPPSTTTFTVNVSDLYGCTATDNVTVYVGGPPGSDIAGIMTYDNGVGTIMNNSTVYLKQGNTIISQTTTDAGGTYSFTGVPAGYYTITGTSSKTWGGVNATDALMILKHFAQVQLLTGLKITGANVNGDPAVNSIDALLVAKRFVGTINSFVIGDWVSESPYFYANVIGNIAMNFKVLCNGDADGSYIPSAKQEAAVMLVNSGIQQVSSDESITLPVKAASNMTLGAISLVMTIPQGISVTELKASKQAMGEILYSISDDQLRIGWYALDAVNFMKDEVIFNLSVKVDGTSDSDWTVGNESVLADVTGTTFPNAVISMPKLVNVAQNGLSTWNQPNPFSEQTNITYTLPLAGNVTVTIYNSLGQEVLVPVNNIQDAGTYSFILDGKTLPVGAYIYKLTLETPDEKFSSANRMLLTR